MSLREPTSVILKSEGRASWGSLSTLVKHNNANSPVLARDSRLHSFVAFGNDEKHNRESNTRHSDEPKRDQESNCHTLSLNISRKATALGEQILNHTRPSLFRMTRNIPERATPRHSDEPKRVQESNCHTRSNSIFHIKSQHSVSRF